MTGSAQIIQADARDLPLADDSVDLIVTSPPYFALRSYQDGGVHYENQIGSEATPAEFVDALLEVTAECVRVLKPTGSLWVNLGDKYARTGGGGGGSSDGAMGRNGTTKKRLPQPLSGSLPQSAGMSRGDAETLEHRSARPATVATGAREKSLIGIPWRYALRCIDDLGLILRAEVIWSKPNGLPESVTDRVRRSHEQWFHFTLQPRYFSAVDEIREPQTGVRNASVGQPSASGNGVRHRQFASQPENWNPLGKLPGSVWTIPDDGDSIVRSVLSAVSAGALTIDEGERILWAQRERASWPTSTHPASVGNGAATGCPADMERRQPSGRDEERISLTASPTSCSSDPSPKGSPSTISVETRDASDRTTSSPSPSQRTSGEHTQSASLAPAATPLPTPTPSAPGTEGSRNGAASATQTDRSDAGESVWVVPTEPLRVPEHLGVDHFAAFPSEFPRRIIQGWSPNGVCVECGEGRRPMTAIEREHGWVRQTVGSGGQRNPGEAVGQVVTNRALATITGYACACPTSDAPTTPSTILDPFGGTGTTALVAKALGRHGISVDMSADYSRLAEWRVNDPAQLAKAARVEKPPRQVDGQLGFDLEGIA